MNARVPYIIFTDLDGSLLDHESYSYEAAGPALAEVETQQIPLIFCTSKTRREVEAARSRLGNRDPFIVENGAAIFVPHGYFSFPIPASRSDQTYLVIELGVPYSKVVAALRRASERSRCRVRGFHDMTTPEVASRCGLTLQEAALAKSREYDEPFDVLSESPAEICGLLNRIEQEGLTWTRGGRFYHIRGRHNKGRAARILAGLFRRLNPAIATVGLGDGPNDISLLDAADVPIVIPSRQRAPLGGWRNSATSWRTAPYPGPRGWNQAVLQLLNL